MIIIITSFKTHAQSNINDDVKVPKNVYLFMLYSALVFEIKYLQIILLKC